MKRIDGCWTFASLLAVISIAAAAQDKTNGSAVGTPRFSHCECTCTASKQSKCINTVVPDPKQFCPSECANQFCGPNNVETAAAKEGSCPPEPAASPTPATLTENIEWCIQTKGIHVFANISALRPPQEIQELCRKEQKYDPFKDVSTRYDQVDKASPEQIQSATNEALRLCQAGIKLQTNGQKKISDYATMLVHLEYVMCTKGEKSNFRTLVNGGDYIALRHSFSEWEKHDDDVTHMLSCYPGAKIADMVATVEARCANLPPNPVTDKKPSTTDRNRALEGKGGGRP
jgi:hypothetical protein